MRPVYALFTLFSTLLVIAGAPGAAAQVTGNDLVSVEAMSSVQTVHPGERFLLAFRFRIEPMWHIYWANPGETGSPTVIDVTPPEGFKLGRVLWQRPQVIPGELTSYGYEHEAVIFVAVKAPDELEPGTATFNASINWLVCKGMCYLGDSEEQITVNTTSEALSDVQSDEELEETENNRSSHGRRFENAQVAEAFARVPRILRRNRRATQEFEGDRIVITGPAKGRDTLTFVPNHSPGVTTRIAEQEIADDRFRLVLEFSVDENNTQGEPPRVAGVINLGTSRDDPAFEVDLPLGGEEEGTRD